MSKQPSWRRLAQAVATAPPDASFTDLVKIAELDPAQDFVNADLSGLSFAGCDLTGYNLTAARLHGCDFTDAQISLATFRMAELDQVMHGADLDPRGPAVLRGQELFGRATNLRSAAQPRRPKHLRWKLEVEGRPVPVKWQTTVALEDAIGSGLKQIDFPRLPTGAIFQDAPFAPEMVVVPSETYLQGDETAPVDGVNRREMTIAHRLAVGRFAVTFEEWDFCHAEGGTKHKPGDEDWGRGRRPVINVSWDDITKDYLPWLNKRLGLSGAHAYRLLSEAEWEYCCRAGTDTAYSFGDTISTAQANYDGNYTFGKGVKGEYRKRTTEVGSFPSNAWGVHDMHGNVWEWCQDIYHDYDGDSPNDGSAREDEPTGKDKTVSRVLRGGSWYSVPQNLRSADRDWDLPVIRVGLTGFRLARTLNP